MKHFDITQTLKSFYHYKQYRYDNLKDGLNYAELDSGHTRDKKLSPP
jgi:hypothetical protein